MLSVERRGNWMCFSSCLQCPPKAIAKGLVLTLCCHWEVKWGLMGGDLGHSEKHYASHFLSPLLLHVPAMMYCQRPKVPGPSDQVPPTPGTKYTCASPGCLRQFVTVACSGLTQIFIYLSHPSLAEGFSWGHELAGTLGILG